MLAAVLLAAAAIALVCLTAAPLAAQDPPAAVQDIVRLARTERIVVHRVTGPVTLDGRPDEPAWADLKPLCMVMQTPTYGEACSERSEALLGYDDEFVYVAGRLFDREPGLIQAPTKKRDAMVATSDWFGVLFDTFNDKENSLAFFTTPAGLRFDAAVYRDGQMGHTMNEMPMNLSWNTFWDVAVARSDEGWFVEMRIPLSSLRFQAEGGDVVMGVTVFRWLSRRSETDVFPAIPKNWGEMSAWKPSQAQETVWPGLRPRRPIYLAPYVLAGADRTYDLNGDETAYVKGGGAKLELGLDFKYGLTGNMTFDATINPDFAQVEADDVQVNLSRFSLFFPEKRLFFQERSSNFDYNMGGPNTLFYSRRIGLVGDFDNDDVEPVRIYGGARLVGRMGGWDIGLLNLQTAALEEFPSENFGVLRLRRQVINPYSYVGGILTSRLGPDGRYGVDYGLDGIWRVGGDDYLTLQFAQTFKNGQTNRAFDLDSARLAVMWERRTTKGFGTQVRFSRTGELFDPAMGFVMMDNYSAFYTRTLYGWFPGKTSPLANHDAFLEARFYWDNATKELLIAEIGPGWEFSAKSGLAAMVRPIFHIDNLLEPLEISDDVIVPVGHYEYADAMFQLATPSGRLLNAIFMGEAGGYYDGWRVSAGVTPTWSGIPDLEIGGMVQYNLVRFPARDASFVAPIGQLRVLATLSVKFSASVLVQWNGADDQVGANLRLRYNPREGTDVYLVYNDGVNVDRLDRVPYPPRSPGRAVYLKCNYTFDF
jgi:hypothetical protein